ncbi:serine hydrolase FSH [Xylogone sp. PMI_703]|nr:serine hydrolase FSH [Xylogone sp. PMI_703]
MKPKDVNLPRILCLHGGGINAEIFRVQCRGISLELANTFRLVFVNAPYFCAPYPGIEELFGDLHPYRRWLRWLEDQPSIRAEAAAEEIMAACRNAMEEDVGGGEWVGIMGFSQGAQVSASILWAQQKVAALPGCELPLASSFKFGVMIAGPAPIVRLDMRVPAGRHIGEASDAIFEDWPESNEGDHSLNMPTLHVHGLQDPGLKYYRPLRDLYCAPGIARLLEWDGGHRLPIKMVDVEKLATEILELAKAAGVQLAS